MAFQRLLCRFNKKWVADKRPIQADGYGLLYIGVAARHFYL